MNGNALNWTELNRHEISLVKFNWNSVNLITIYWLELIWIDLNWIELNWIELSWIELNWIEWNWIKLNWIEFELIELNWFKSSHLSKHAVQRSWGEVYFPRKWEAFAIEKWKCFTKTDKIQIFCSLNTPGRKSMNILIVSDSLTISERLYYSSRSKRLFKMVFSKTAGVSIPEENALGHFSGHTMMRVTRHLAMMRVTRHLDPVCQMRR